MATAGSDLVAKLASAYRLSKPGFFLDDPRLIVRLDSVDVYDGNFKSGVHVWRGVAPGSHNVATRIESMGLSRSREYAATVAPDTDLTVTLRHSRSWGNFSRRPELPRHD